MGNEPFDTLDDLPTIRGDDGSESKLLAGRYRIIRKLGEGGMGLVYLAEDTELGNIKVAIKFIPPALAGNIRAINNLKKEAQTAMQLSHPNIVRLHDLHTDGHQKFLVMEYIEGKTLEEILAEKPQSKLTLQELLPVAEQAAAGLDYAHKKKVLHRDIKPSNIMIAADGTVKILDFGIAREMKDSFTRITGKETSGTLPYMSPQQLMGEPPTPLMDIYSFAAVLYECLGGHPPFYMGDIREQIKSKIPSALSGVSTAVNDAILSALSKDPTQRPKTASELLAFLQGRKKPPKYKDTLDYAKTISIEAQKTKSRWTKIIAATAVVLFVVIGSYLAIKAYRQDESSSTEAQQLWSQAQSFAERGEYPKAIEICDRIIAQYPTLEQAQAALSQKSAWSKVLADRKEKQSQIAALLSGAQTLKNQGLLDKSLEAIAEVLKLDPENEQAKKLRVELSSLLEKQKSAAEEDQTLGTYLAEITNDDVDIRSGPATNYYLCGKLKKGEKVQVINTQLGWSRIAPPPDSFSWISVQYVSTDPNNKDTGIVTGDDVNVYAGSEFIKPMHSTSLQIKLNRGDKVKLFGEQQDNYYKIAPPSGAYLWVSTTHTKRLAPLRGSLIVLVEYKARADLVPVQAHFAEYGIETEIVAAGGRYLLITKNKYDNPNTPGSDGYAIKQKIIDVGAKYKGKAPAGYETFAPNFFKDAYGKKKVE